METKLNTNCDGKENHEICLADIQKSMPDEEKLIDLSEFYKVFGDSTRIRILYCLYDRELCVCHIAEILGMTLSAISHQLRILKNAHLVKSKREGKTIIYSLADDHVHSILHQGMDHINE